MVSQRAYKLSLAEKIRKLEAELKAEKQPTPEEREEQRQRSEYERRCQSVFAQIDDEILLLLQYESEHGRRLEKLKTLRIVQRNMLEKVPFHEPLRRPIDRPNPFEGFSDSDIAKVSYKDATVLRFGSPQEKGTIRKKYLGKGKETDSEDWKTTPAPPTG